jgi:predicted kinase
VARRTHSDLVPLHCTTPTGVARHRLATRERTASDATAAIATALAADADPWPEARIVLTTGTVADSVDRAVTVWEAAAAVTAPGRLRP